ncbi:MAG: response regulator transcription factor [Flavobacteriia bacterium]|jgi:DNA-binding NarL/FixJ family response regulator
MLKILICDDHLLFAKGLAEVLITVNSTFKVHAVSSWEDCVEYIQENEFDVFLCDLNINNRDGFDLIEEIKEYLILKKIIIISAYFEDFIIQKAFSRGLHAFLKKDTTVEELVKVINLPLPMDFYTNGTFSPKQDHFGENIENISKKFNLSKQEKEIIRLVVKGNQSKEIAEILHISKNTVDTHRKNINRKLEITNKATLYQFAYENDLLH